jgi:hypothetical protein
MPVKEMTEEDKKRFFGNGFVIFGQKRPTPSKSNSKELLPKAEQQPSQKQ